MYIPPERLERLFNDEPKSEIIDPSYVASFSRNGHELPAYHIRSLTSVAQRHFVTDGSYTFTLEEHKPIAVIAFDFLSHGIMYVKQIQGGIGSEEQLQKIRWQRLLLSYLVDWARSAKASQVRVQPARRNKYYNNGPEEDQASKKQLNERLETHYDSTAKSLGFILSDDEEYYYLDL